jgi:hypothetical protein
MRALTVFLNKVKHTDIANCAIDEDQQEAIRDICGFLQIPHAVQELLSGEQTLTLSEALPQYENLLVICAPSNFARKSHKSLVQSM